MINTKPWIAAQTYCVKNNQYHEDEAVSCTLAFLLIKRQNSK